MEPPINDPLRGGHNRNNLSTKDKTAGHPLFRGHCIICQNCWEPIIYDLLYHQLVLHNNNNVKCLSLNPAMHFYIPSCVWLTSPFELTIFINSICLYSFIFNTLIQQNSIIVSISVLMTTVTPPLIL